MKATINIESDQELRAYVKEMIRNQVKSISREEIRGILEDTVSKKVKNTDITGIDVILREELTKLIRESLGNSNWREPNFIQKEAKALVEQYIKQTFRERNILG